MASATRYSFTNTLMLLIPIYFFSQIIQKKHVHVNSNLVSWIKFLTGNTQNIYMYIYHGLYIQCGRLKYFSVCDWNYPKATYVLLAPLIQYNKILTNKLKNLSVTIYIIIEHDQCQYIPVQISATVVIWKYMKVYIHVHAEY